MNSGSSTEDILQVPEAANGQRLDSFIAGRYTCFSRAHIQRCISEGLIRLNGKIAKKRVAVKAGDRITVAGSELGSKAQKTLIAEDIPLDVIYEDEWLLAVNKPAGMVVHPGSGNWSGTLVNALLAGSDELSSGFQEDRPGIVHRLDKDTSGLLLVAKNDCIHAALADLFCRRLIDKHYIGICVGARPFQHDLIDAPIARSRSNPVLRTVHRGGKSAQTGYELLHFTSGVSVLRFRLHTGRTHQIRVHCRHAGFPILGDVSYGGGREQVQLLEPLQRPVAYKVLKCFSRQALHAYSLKLVHPVTEKELFLRAPLPEDFCAALECLELDFEIV